MSQSKKHLAVIEKRFDQATLLSLVATSSLPVERISDYSNDLPKLQYYYALMLLHGYINNAIKWWKKSASQQSTALEEHRYIRFAKGNLLMIRYLGSTIVRLLNQLDRRPKTNIHPDTKAAKKFPSDWQEPDFDLENLHSILATSSQSEAESSSTDGVSVPPQNETQNHVTT